MNEVASARSFDGPTSKSKPKAPTKTSKKPEIVESELENAAATGGEDDTKEHEAARSLDGPTSKSKSKAPTKTLKKPKIVENVASELENAAAMGDEDDTKERQAALSSPVKGKDSRQLTAVRFTYHSPPFLIVVID